MSEEARSNKTGKKASKKQNFLANEVCYGLAIAAACGFTYEEAIATIKEDFEAWAKEALPKGKKEKNET